MEPIKLTEKELRFIELKAQGRKMWQIATQLLINTKYAEQIANDLYKKTGTTNGASLISWAYENSILKINSENLPSKPDKAA